MTGRERIVAVLEHRLPDRVPLAELWIDPGVVRAALPGKNGYDLADRLDLDMVVSAYSMIYEDHEVEWVDRQKRIFRDKWGALQMAGTMGCPFPPSRRGSKPPRIWPRIGRPIRPNRP